VTHRPTSASSGLTVEVLCESVAEYLSEGRLRSVDVVEKPIAPSALWYIRDEALGTNFLTPERQSLLMIESFDHRPDAADLTRLPIKPA